MNAPAAELQHPRGLRTLFFTEMWERFSYYGMRALLVLFMVDSIEKGGLALDDRTATAIYGLYTSFAYLASLPGGWIGDRLLGAQRAVWIGGIIIAAGHFTLALPSMQTFFLGLVLIVIGTALLKPNMSVMVSHLYPEGGARRDAGFTIFYMGVNLGAALGPLVCSWLGERLNWHYGFAAAGVGMVLGLIQFRLSARHLGDAGLHPHGEVRSGRHAWLGVGIGMSLLLLVVVLALTGVLRIAPIALAQKMAYAIVGIGACYAAGIFILGRLDAAEKKRVAAILVLVAASALFWSGFEQAGSSLSLFAERYTVRAIAGFVIPAGWFQALNPVFIITLAPAFAALWVRLAFRNRDLSMPGKFAAALLLLGLGFLVMAAASHFAAASGKVLPTWLITTYLIHTMGELCLSPVGLSAVSKLAPPRFVGQLMGLWFLATALGNLLAGIFAGSVHVENPGEMSALYLRIVGLAMVGVVALLCIMPIFKRLTTSASVDPMSPVLPPAL
jgi:POT family proton-dependent oligopeptide transporter